MGISVYRCNLLKTALVVVVLLFFLTGHVSAITVEVTGNPQDWVFTQGSNENNLTVVHVSGTTDTWAVNVRDALDYGKKSSSAGRLLEYNPTEGNWVNTGSILSNNLTLVGPTATGQGLTGYSVALGPSDQLLEKGAGDQTWNVTLNQAITYNDPYLSNGHIYRVYLTLDVSEGT